MLMVMVMEIIGDEGRFATYCLKRLTRTLQKGERRLPPSEVELEAVRNRRSIIVRVHMMDGQAKALDLDASTSTKEVSNTPPKTHNRVDF